MSDARAGRRDLIGLVVSLLRVYIVIVAIRVIVSWFKTNPHNVLVQILRALVDPALGALRHVEPRFLWSSGVDFTPLLLIVLIQLVIVILQRLR